MSWKMKCKLFLASGLWGISIFFSFWEDLFMALGNKLVGLEWNQEDD